MSFTLLNGQTEKSISSRQPPQKLGIKRRRPECYKYLTHKLVLIVVGTSWRYDFPLVPLCLSPNPVSLWGCGPDGFCQASSSMCCLSCFGPPLSPFLSRSLLLPINPFHSFYCLAAHPPTSPCFGHIFSQTGWWVLKSVVENDRSAGVYLVKRGDQRNFFPIFVLSFQFRFILLLYFHSN